MAGSGRVPERGSLECWVTRRKVQNTWEQRRREELWKGAELHPTYSCCVCSAKARVRSWVVERPCPPHCSQQAHVLGDWDGRWASWSPPTSCEHLPRLWLELASDIVFIFLGANQWLHLVSATQTQLYPTVWRKNTCCSGLTEGWPLSSTVLPKASSRVILMILDFCLYPLWNLTPLKDKVHWTKGTLKRNSS